MVLGPVTSATMSLVPPFVLVLIVVGAVGLVVLTFLRSRTWGDASSLGSEAWAWRVRESCEDYRSVVDQLRPQRAADFLPSTAALAEVQTRLSGLDASLDGLIADLPEKTAEAMEDIQRVSVSLRSALQAERATRLSSDPEGWSTSESSTQLVMKRAAELEAAVQAALWTFDSN